VLRESGLDVYDRLDLMRPEQMTGVPLAGALDGSAPTGGEHAVNSVLPLDTWCFVVCAASDGLNRT